MSFDKLYAEIYSEKTSRNYRKLVTAAVVAIVVLTAMLTATRLLQKTAFAEGEYNIVYLDNSLFYFCLLSDLNSEYLECGSPYYLARTEETQEDGSTQERVYVTTPAAEEIYQPEGSIFLRKERVVYIAKVGTDSPVLKSIWTQAL